MDSSLVGIALSVCSFMVAVTSVAACSYEYLRGGYQSGTDALERHLKDEQLLLNDEQDQHQAA